MAKDISRTLIIGLGGTGQSVIREIKKRLFRRYGEIPDLVKFLSFDTDANAYEDTPFQYYYEGKNNSTKKYNLQNDEFCMIARPGIDVLKEDPNCRNLNFEQLGKIYGLANGMGANGYRVMGRAHFLYNAGNIMQRLWNTVSGLKNAQLSASQQERGYHLSNNSISVYVIASLAGGTGSSAFMDLSRMLQHAGIDVIPHGVGSPTDKIFGVFFMPSFFSTKPNTPNVKINTYVALSELDYTLGLNDEQKYPEGSRERESDLNVYEQYTSYKSVRYSNVYLIDEKTRKGHAHSFDEAAGYVASFIAASIAADNQALDSSYSNSTHRLHSVDDKKQIYSGLGYCEIRFERQNLVRYLLNRQIRDILNVYKSGEGTVDIDKIADAFISQNALNEGVMSTEEGMEDTRSQLNELTDAIYMLNDKRFSIPMKRVETGREADTLIVQSKVAYLNSIASEATTAIKGFELKKKTILKNLVTLLDERQSQKGFGCFPDLSKRLKTSFEDMKLGLEDEVSKHEAKEQTLDKELKKIQGIIKNNSSTGFIGIGSRKEEQQNAIRSYIAKVEGIATEANPSLARLKLEILRKQEAIKVYQKLIDTIDLYYKEEEKELDGNRKSIETSGTSLDIQKSYDGLKRLVDSENNAYQPSAAAKNETIFADAYFKQFFEEHENAAFELNEQGKANMEALIRKLFDKKEKASNELLAKLRESLLKEIPEDALIKRIEQKKISFDQLFIHCFGQAREIEDDHDLERYPQLGLFSQVETLFDSLWQYDAFATPGSQKVALQCVVGVFDTTNHLLDQNNGYKAFIPNNHSYQFINVGDPDRIVFMLQETAIPAFKMCDAIVWKNEYKAKKDFTYSFSDKRLEEIDMIFPEKTDEIGDIAWAYGWMFGLIASVSGRVQVKVTNPYLTKHHAVRGNKGYYDYFGIHTQKPSDLSVCHRKFVRDNELFTDIYNQVKALIDSDRNGAIVKISHWVNDEEMWRNRGKLRQSMDEQERLVIQNEPEFLEKRFNLLNTQAVTVRYDITSGRIVYSDAIGVLAEKEKEYKAPQE